MSDRDQGQVDTSAAEVYDSLFVPALFGRFAESLAELARPARQESVVDIACGTGALTRLLRARTDARVVGVDLNPAMIAVARRRGNGIEYEQGDAVALPYRDDEFDVATCQYGLMFVPDPSAAVAEMTRVATRGLVAVWDSIDGSPGYRTLQQLFRDELGDDAAASLDAPFAMGAPGVLEEVFAGAGVPRPEFTSIEGTGRFDSIEHWVTTEVRGWTLGDSVSGQQLSDLVAVAQDRLGRFATPDGCIFAMSTRVATWSSGH